MGGPAGRGNLIGGCSLRCSLAWSRKGHANRTVAPGNRRGAFVSLHAQEWADLGEQAADIVRQVEAGRMSEAEADERMRPAVLYQVCALWQHPLLPLPAFPRALARFRL